MIDKYWLQEKKACQTGVKWFYERFGRDANEDCLTVLDSLISDERLYDANWFIVRIMSRGQYLKYAVFSAEQVIDIFESRYPDEKLQRKAIEAAKIVIDNDTEENRVVADDAASAAAAAAASAAAYAAVYTAAAASCVNEVAASYAADAATYAATRDMVRLKILNYGRSLIIDGVEN